MCVVWRERASEMVVIVVCVGWWEREREGYFRHTLYDRLLAR